MHAGLAGVYATLNGTSMTPNGSSAHLDEPAVRYLPAGDTAVVVEFGNTIDRDVSRRVLALSDAIMETQIEGVVEAVPTFRSLLVHYDPRLKTGQQLIEAIRGLLGGLGKDARRHKVWRVPVCYSPECGPDLADVAARTGLSIEQVIAEHVRVHYHVYMIGFVPGFPYLGELSDKISLPRRSEPRAQVPPGSVAIAAGMSSIYPIASPGGWHLIGATPIRLFNQERASPALFASGDRVIFEAIGRDAYEAMCASVQSNSYELPCAEVAA